MDVRAYLQTFERSLNAYTGDDPLEPWDGFVQYIEGRLPAEEKHSISVVLDRVVQRFLEDDRYHNDLRYVHHCIKCASFYSDPIKLYSYVYGRGVGTQAAPLYVAWAQQFEKKGLLPQAEAVYQRALENQAKPADSVLQEYRLFQCRTAPIDAVRNPLQNSNLINQSSRQRDTVQPQCKEAGEPQFPDDKTVHIISKSANWPSNRPNKANENVQFISMYCVNDLVSDGVEYCFEELRANRYWAKRKHQEQQREIVGAQRRLQEDEEDLMRMKRLLQEMSNIAAENPTPVQQDLVGLVPQSSLQPECPPVPVRNEVTGNQHCGPLSSRASLGPALTARREPESPSLQERSRAQSMGGLLGSVQPPPAYGSFFAPVESEPLHRELDLDQQGPAGKHLSTSSLIESQRTSAARAQANESAHPGLHRTETIAGAQPGPNRSLLSCSVNSCVSGSVISQQPPAGDHYALKTVEPAEMESYNEGVGNVSGGPGNRSHVTPNTSFGLAQTTPCQILPSPTVHTREALEQIMDMFQAPTFMDHGSSWFAEQSVIDAVYPKASHAPVSTHLPAAAPFVIFQDENDQQNRAVGIVASNKSRPPLALVEIPVSKSSRNDGPAGAESMTDETAMWGACSKSLAACPNSTRDFSMLANLVSTPFHPSAPHSWDLKPENDAPRTFGDSEENPFMRQPTKLSPIIEQSPSEEKVSSDESVMRSLGTIVGEGLTAVALQSQTSCSISNHPLAALSFPDHTVTQTDEDAPPKSPSVPRKSSWSIYQSPEKTNKPQQAEKKEPCSGVALPQTRTSNSFLSRVSFHGSEMESGSPENQSPFQTAPCDVPMSPEPQPKPVTDVPMSPDPSPRLDWFHINSPVPEPEPDLDVFLKPNNPDCLVSANFGLCLPEVPQSPDKRSVLESDVPMSPEQTPLMQTVPSGAVDIVPNPWDQRLIDSLLSTVTPLNSYPGFTFWDCTIPNINPKITVKMADYSLRVDFVLGEGAFATVYQATNLTTSEKLILKVQKPANPWEFYIDVQLNHRLQPRVRHLFNIIRAAHLFKNGSVLLGDLHNCGTLLNAVNLYKNRSEKVMPHALVLYFASCILHMVEQLHRARVIHADIKPDNFMLGERFLENECFDQENVDHGLALIDMGQSIDMSLFPEGTAFTARCLTSGFQCTEMLSGRPWTYQTDYFGIAGTVHCMIFGTYMKASNDNGVWKTNGIFKRNPHCELWQEFFHTLLNVPDCSSLPCLRSLRSRVHAELLEHYSTKLRSLKNRLVVQLLEARTGRK